MNPVPFNRPYLTGKEIHYIQEAHSLGQLAGDGHFTKLCSSWIERKFNCSRVLLTHSCTAALEMTAILANIEEGDEVIMPSYTFVSTANAFALRGARPVFVEIREDTLNIDERLIESAITPRTKAIVVVHYAGVSCEMDYIMLVAGRYNLIVIEDAAQGIMSSYKGRPLGTIGHLGCLSFHETKNIISGEGGALLINDESLVERAEVIREKGTNRTQFSKGLVDKYRWIDIGSSYLPGELIAAFLWAQLQSAERITELRMNIWQHYQDGLEDIINLYVDQVQTPSIPSNRIHNGHMFFLILENQKSRDDFIASMREKQISCVFHYVPLHTSPEGMSRGRAAGGLPLTESLAHRLVRLPLWVGIEKEQARVVDTICAYFKQR